MSSTLRSCYPGIGGEHGGSRARVLVVDDRPAHAAVLGRILEDAGFLVIVAGDADSAVRAFQAQAPDVVLSEVFLSESSGLDLCRRLRREERGHRAGVVMMTSAINAALPHRAMEAGADDYLQQPVTHAALVARLRSHVARKRLDALLERVG